MKRVFIFILTLAFLTILIGYTQFLKKETISAVLQYEIDLNNPSDFVFAITTLDQKLATGKNLAKGTRFFGMLTKENENYVVYFNTLQLTNGNKESFLAKSNLNLNEETKAGGVSAKISKTLYKQTKSNVLGAIFKSPSDVQMPSSLVLPKGSTLKIEIN